MIWMIDGYVFSSQKKGVNTLFFMVFYGFFYQLGERT